MTKPQLLHGFPVLLSRDPRAAGTLIQQIVWTEDALALIGDDYGWNDGGGALLARALGELVAPLPHQRIAVVSGVNPGLAQHVLLQVEVNSTVWFLDADGTSTERELLDRWRLTEKLVSPAITRLDSVAVSPETPDDPLLAKTISTFLAGQIARKLTPEEH